MGPTSDVSLDASLLVDDRPTGSVAVDTVAWAVRVVRGAAHSRMMVVVVVMRPRWHDLLVVVVLLLGLCRKAHCEDKKVCGGGCG